jgi:hypothetical protein
MCPFSFCRSDTNTVFTYHNWLSRQDSEPEWFWFPLRENTVCYSTDDLTF